MITFLLLIIGITLLVLNFKALKNEKNTFDKTFNDATINLKDYDIEIGKLRQEFGETIFELQQEIESLKDNKYKLEEKVEIKAEVKKINDENINNKVSKKNKKTLPEIDKKNNVENDLGINNIKVNEIKEMLSEGLSIDTISEKLGMGKGELLLIEKLYLK